MRCLVITVLLIACGPASAAAPDGGVAAQQRMPASVPATGPATQQAIPATQPFAPMKDAPADPEAPTVSAWIEPAEGRVGDLFVLTVTAVHTRAVAVNLPTTLDLAPFVVLERLPDTASDLGNSRLKRDFLLKVAAYETGDLVVPPVPVTYLTVRGEARTVHTQPVPVRIVSVLANENSPELRGNPAPVPVLQRDYTILFVLGGLAFLGVGVAVGFFLRRWLRERALRALPPPPPRPVEEVAREKLGLLEQEGLIERGEFREYYFKLSEIVREYLGGRYGFPAIDLTTTEIVGELIRRGVSAAKGGRQLGRGASSEGTGGLGEPPPDIGAWLFAADLVKFAKHEPSQDEARAALADAYAIIAATTPLAPVEPLPPGMPERTNGQGVPNGEHKAAGPSAQDPASQRGNSKAQASTGEDDRRIPGEKGPDEALRGAEDATGPREGGP